jgi:ornithine carbamoyltransferase
MHLITLLDWETDRVRELLALAHELKARAGEGELEPTLAGKSLALLFEKRSMRTRVSFEVAMTQLGGHAVYLSREDVDLGAREPIKDGARVLSRYVDGIAARVNSHASVEELAAYAEVPVINALSDMAHPCQALADALTIQEHFPDADGVKVAFIGDANNVSRSLAVVCARLGLQFAIAGPIDYGFEAGFAERVGALAAETGATFAAVASPAEAVADADVIYTDVWTSMGQEAEAEERRRAFAGFCVDEELVARAPEHVIVMHDMPAHRGEEITDGVIEGPNAVLFDQAENRLHAERALLQMLLG